MVIFSGIGFELAKTLARCGVRVVLVCRNEKRGNAALEEVRKVAVPPKGKSAEEQVSLVLADVSNPVSVVRGARELAQMCVFASTGTRSVDPFASTLLSSPVPIVSRVAAWIVWTCCT